jgi:hypothetical protein
MANNTLGAEPPDPSAPGAFEIENEGQKRVYTWTRAQIDVLPNEIK